MSMQPLTLTLTLTVRQFVLNVPHVTRVWVACSGGVDSTVLLHCVAKAGLDCPVAALHVNHQLSPHADVWQQRVQDLCDSLGVECFHERVQIDAHGSGIEQAARRSRYRAFEHYLQEGDLLLTAHHQQDQAETFVLRLMRGAGLRGLGAMAPLRTHGVARIGRPLLQHRKEDLLSYARGHQLQWAEDESNSRQVFDRNYVRAQVTPVLHRRWPRALQQIGRSTQLLQEAEALLADYAADDIAQCEPRVERVGQSVLLQPLREWPEARRNHVLRSWLVRLGYRMPEQKQFVELARLLAALEDKSPVLQWQDCEIRRFQQRLYCLPKDWQPAAGEANVEGQRMHGRQAYVSDRNRLLVNVAGQGLAPGRAYTAKLRCHCPEVNRAHPAARAHSQSLKKLLQEHLLEPWLRPWLPLVFAEGELVAVADLWVEKDHLHVGEQALALSWRIGPAADRL